MESHSGVLQSSPQGQPGDQGQPGELDSELLGRIHPGDCVAGMGRLADGCVDLVFADPPFNIGFSYDVYKDRLDSDQYVHWSRQWMAEVHRVLKSSGSFWLAIGDEYAAELKVAAMRLGFTCRSWVIWYYTFGVHCKHKFTRSHAHLFHFVKDAEHFKFNNHAVRVPSARQLVYADRRANSAGRMPDDTWVLRPQDLVDGFTPGEDVWYFPRVAGTFKERAGFHGCQMPEQLLGRIIRSCSDEQDVVMDPFSGSSTTVAVAKKLSRRWLSFELSEEYVALGTTRLAAISPGDPLDGSAEPNVSVPATGKGKSKLAGTLAEESLAAAAGRPRGRKPASSKHDEASVGVTITLPRPDPALGFPQGLFDFDAMAGCDEQLIDAFAQACQGYSLDRVIADPVLCEDLQRVCERLGIAGTPAERNRRLFRLRGAGQLKAAAIQTQQRTLFSWQEQSPYRFASEIAWRRLADEYPKRTLDELFCDPRTAAQFDILATRYCPGYRPLEYRWAALTLRRRAATLRDADGASDSPSCQWHDLSEQIELAEAVGGLPSTAAVFAIGSDQSQISYVGETDDLRASVDRMFATAAQLQLWECESERAKLWYHSVPPSGDSPLRRQWDLARQLKPRWNVLDLAGSL